LSLTASQQGDVLAWSHELRLRVEAREPAHFLNCRLLVFSVDCSIPLAGKFQAELILSSNAISSSPPRSPTLLCSMRSQSISLALLLALLCGVSIASSTYYGFAFGGDFQISGSELSSAVVWQNGTFFAIGGGVPFEQEGQRTGFEVKVVEEYNAALFIGG
jgi:hypothetical protein